MSKFKLGNSVKVRLNKTDSNGEEKYIEIKGKYIGVNQFGTVRVLGISNENNKEIKLYNVQSYQTKYMDLTRLDKNLSQEIDNKIKENKNKKYLTLDEVEDILKSKNINYVKINNKESIGVFRQPMYLSITIYKDGEPYEEFKGTSNDYEYDGSSSIYYDSGEKIVRNNWSKLNKLDIDKFKKLGITNINYDVYYRGENTQCLRVSYNIYNKDDNYNIENIMNILKYLKTVLTD